MPAEVWVVMIMAAVGAILMGWIAGGKKYR